MTEKGNSAKFDFASAQPSALEARKGPSVYDLSKVGVMVMPGNLSPPAGRACRLVFQCRQLVLACVLYDVAVV